MKRTMMISLALVALGAAGAACDQNRNTKPTSPTTASRAIAQPKPVELPPVAGEREPLDDQDIADAVERELLIDSSVDTTTIAVRTNEGIVELTGTVGNLLAKRRATEIARTVKGVRSVSNQIAVELVERSDDELAKAVEKALLRDPAADAYEVAVAAKDGVVTLSGEVTSWHERQLAERLALRVRGAKEVNNELTVQYSAERTDPEIERDVESALQWDALVDHPLISVDVDGGAVSLSGTVGSAAEKARAIGDAWVKGTHSVDASGLKVEWWAKDEDVRKRPFVIEDDAEIADAITKAALYDPRVLSFNVRPIVNHGVVSLHGTVDNLKAKQVAETLARNTTGVIAVRNYINVRPDQPVGDKILAGFIVAGLETNPITEAYEVEVEVDNGIAKLSGKVDTFAEKAEAEDIALRVSGVVGVINEIEVKTPSYALVFDDAIDGPDVIDWMVYVPRTTEVTDETIEESIENELLWDPDTDAWQITVDVSNAVATLTGEVDSQFERREATANALEGGALAVVNHLTVAR